MSNPALRASSAPDSALPVAPKIHPDFSEPEDIVLRSSDNVHFHVARRDLERTSKWFCEMFNAATRTSSDGTSEEIPVFENAATLEIVLGAALSREVAETITTLSRCEAALDAAMKYQMDGVAQQLKRTLECLLWRSKDAWEQFILASRYKLQVLKDDALERCIGDKPDYDELSRLEKDDLIFFLKERDTRIRLLTNIVQSNGLSQSTLHPLFNLDRGKCTTCSQALQPEVEISWRKFQCTFLKSCSTYAGVDQLFAHSGVRSAATTVGGLMCPRGHYPFYDLRSQVADGLAAKRRQK